MGSPLPHHGKPPDAIVVGSGITGGWAAKELCERGLQVLLLERGPNVVHGVDYVTEHLAPWMMPFRGKIDRRRAIEHQPIQSKCYACDEYASHFFVDDRQHPYESDASRPFSWIRGYQLGGRSITWGRQVYRWSDLDFKANAMDGNGIPWPISYADIASWYDHVEDVIGVSGNRDGVPELPDGRFLPPMPLTPVEMALQTRLQTSFAGRRLISGRVAVLTVPHRGRAACHYCGPCERGCSLGAYFSSLSSTLPAAKRTGNLQIRTDTIVERVLFDPSLGRATGVAVIDASTHAREILCAPLIFLCASTLASTQILLNSRSETFPGGLGNSSGTLGRYLMDHAMFRAVAAEAPGFEDWTVFGQRPSGFYIPRFRNRDGHSTDFLRGYAYQGGSFRSSWARGLQGSDFGVPAKERMSRLGPWNIWVSGFGECLPRRDNAVTLSDGPADTWGLPRLKISFAWG